MIYDYFYKILFKYELHSQNLQFCFCGYNENKIKNVFLSFLKPWLL